VTGPTSDRRNPAVRDRRRGGPDVAALAAAAGAAAGGVAGALGSAVKTLAGGLAKAGGPRATDRTAEEAYWKDRYDREPYFLMGYGFADYLPAYRTGWEGRSRYPGKSFEEAENDLQFDYENNRGKSRLEWEGCREAVRAAWDRAGGG
jgi:hypothetical protein